MDDRLEKTLMRLPNRAFRMMSRFVTIATIMILSVNIGKLLGDGIFKLILWLGILPYLEKFFAFIVW